MLSFYRNKKKTKKQVLLISMQLECEHRESKMVKKMQTKKAWMCIGVLMYRTLTNAPITPRLVRRKYSKGRVLLVVFKKGYRKRGMWAVCSCGGWWTSQQMKIVNSYFFQLACVSGWIENKKIYHNTIEKETPSLWMTGDTLQKRQGVADAVGGVGCQSWRHQQWVHWHDLLQQRRHHAWGHTQRVGSKRGEGG